MGEVVPWAAAVVSGAHLTVLAMRFLRRMDTRTVTPPTYVVPASVRPLRGPVIDVEPRP